MDCIIETTEKVLVCELHHIKSTVFFLKEGVREEWVNRQGREKWVMEEGERRNG